MLEDSDEWVFSEDSDGLDSEYEELTLHVSNLMNASGKGWNIS